jgi:hypothetical protein
MCYFEVKNSLSVYVKKISSVVPVVRMQNFLLVGFGLNPSNGGIQILISLLIFRKA